MLIPITTTSQTLFEILRGATLLPNYLAIKGTRNSVDIQILNPSSTNRIFIETYTTADTTNSTEIAINGGYQTITIFDIRNVNLISENATVNAKLLIV
jgi:hypothetical protein